MRKPLLKTGEWAVWCAAEKLYFIYVHVSVCVRVCVCVVGREFFYIQMEKYSRQALAEGVKNINDLVATTDCELYRVLVLHYNRNNQIEVCTSDVNPSPCLGP